jgi:xanthine dehydrogenase accessory factor
MKNIYLQIPFSQIEISELVLATVTKTQGSTPQKPGSAAIFNRTGLVAGTIGGGVLEGKVQEMAFRIIESKNPVHHVFYLDADMPGGEDALCGGRISVLLDPDLARHGHIFREIRECSEKRIPGILITKVISRVPGNITIEREWTTDMAEYLSAGSETSGFLEIKPSSDSDETGTQIFLEPVIPLPRLVIAGAGHIGKALSQLGKMLDFEVTVIDDRPEYANSSNLPSADRIIAGPVGKSLEEIDSGSDTYIVIVTRGHRDDGEALKACIDSDAAYIGMIGSKTKVALMKRDFIEKHLATDEQWNRIYAPIGIDISSRTVEEIAVSIAAQLIQVRSKKMKT